MNDPALDALRWVVARVRLDADNGSADEALADDVEHHLRRLTISPGRYSDGTAVVGPVGDHFRLWSPPGTAGAR